MASITASAKPIKPRLAQDSKVDDLIQKHLFDRVEILDKKVDLIISELSILARHDQRIEHNEVDLGRIERKINEQDKDIYGKDGLFQKVTRNTVITNGVTFVCATLLSTALTIYLPQTDGESSERTRENSESVTSRDRIPGPTERQQWLETHSHGIKRFDLERNGKPDRSSDS